MLNRPSPGMELDQGGLEANRQRSIQGGAVAVASGEMPSELLAIQGAVADGDSAVVSAVAARRTALGAAVG